MTGKLPFRAEIEDIDGTVRFDTLQVIPSYNDYGRKNWRTQRKLKADWQNTFRFLMMDALLPRPLIAVRVNVELRFPDPNRKRDSGNFRVGMEKWMGDALVDGKYISDDVDAYYWFDQLVISKEKGPRRTTVWIDYRM